MDKYTLLDRKQIYSGPVFKVYKDAVQTRTGKTVNWDLVDHNDAAGIIAVKDGKILFVRQYRHPANEALLEIPAGILNEGETPLEAALRELEEETGFKAAKMTFLTKFYSMVGICNEMLHVYYTEGLIEGNQHFDEDEDIELEEYSLSDAVKMIFDGRIVDSKTIIALLAYKEIMANA